jgi:hypothetical protein
MSKENPEECIEKLLEIVGTFSKVIDSKINIKKLIEFLCNTNNKLEICLFKNPSDLSEKFLKPEAKKH